MPQDTLSAFVQKTAEEFGIPGVAVGIWADGQEIHACHGVTSLENPLPVDRDTLFSVGSISKTFTATALMRLVAEGRVELEAPVREYVPELVLADEQAAADITVLNLLNHTAGLGWRNIADTGAGDDALAAQVAKLAGLDLLAPPGTRASYSQEGFNLAGRIVEKVTGLTFEQAVAELVLEPLGLPNTTYSLDHVITRRFAVGHNLDETGTPAVARQWKDTRANNPGGGIASTVADQLRWARFHLGDSTTTTTSAAAVLPAETRHQMQQPTATLRGSSLGDAFGICWFLRTVDGVQIVGHGGSGNGQFADLQLVPERDFAVATLTNAGPTGVAFNQTIVRWALNHYLGITDQDPEPAPYNEPQARELTGTYENDAMTFTIATDGTALTIEIKIKPEIRASSDLEMPADYAPFDIALLPGETDEYIVTNGPLKGQRGFFTRTPTGTITGVDMAGRLFTRTNPPHAEN